MQNIFKQIIDEKAYCATHLTAKVGRNYYTQQWPKQCIQGWREIQQGREAKCQIVIEKGGEEKK